MKSCQIDLHIALNSVELLLQEGNFGHNTYTQIHTITYV